MTEEKDKKREKRKEKKEVRDPKSDQRLKELEELLKRTQADFINYKNRAEQERKDLLKYASTQTILKVVPVLDNFSLALSHKPDELKGNSWVEGVEYIRKQLEDILREEGIEKIETVGKDFDHNLHEAVGSEKDETKKDDQIIREVEAGYKMGEKIIKPAKVIVAKNN